MKAATMAKKATAMTRVEVGMISERALLPASSHTSKRRSAASSADRPSSDRASAARAEARAYVIDAHVHLHPDRLAEAIRRWFDAHAWDIRYRGGVDEAVRTLIEGGV